MPLIFMMLSRWLLNERKLNLTIFRSGKFRRIIYSTKGIQLSEMKKIMVNWVTDKCHTCPAHDLTSPPLELEEVNKYNSVHVCRLYRHWQPIPSWRFNGSKPPNAPKLLQSKHKTNQTHYIQWDKHLGLTARSSFSAITKWPSWWRQNVLDSNHSYFSSSQTS